MSGLASALLAIAVLAAFLLAWGGYGRLKRGERKQGWLMIGAGAMTLLNIYGLATVAVPRSF
jgi:hypothetical protein